MRRPRHRLALVALTVLSACSGGDKIVAANGTPSTPSGGTPSGGGTANRLAAADSVFLVNFISAGAWSLMKQMRTIVSIQQPGFANARPACTPQSVIGGLDNDRNGIPDDQTTTYAASSCSFLSAGFNTTANGAIRLQDLGTLYGYRVTYTNYVLTGTKGDSSVVTTINGSLEFRYASGTSGSAVDNTTQTTRQQTSAGSITLTRTAALTGTLTPTAGAFSSGAFSGATMAVTGTLNIALALTGNAVQAGFPTSSTFNMAVSSSPALTSPATCLSTPGFTSGTLTGALTGTWTATLRQTYTTCGSGAGENPGKR